MKGTIKTLRDNGFGFITPEDGGKDVFFHSTEVQGTTFNELNVGDVVTFEMADSDRGPKAVGVTRA